MLGKIAGSVPFSCKLVIEIWESHLFFFAFLFQNFLQVLRESLNFTFVFFNHLWRGKQQLIIHNTTITLEMIK